MAKSATTERHQPTKTLAAEVPANILEVTSQKFERPAAQEKVPVSELRLPLYSEEAVYELIKSSGLWDDKFLYSAVFPDRRFIGKHGTYRKTKDGKPLNTVYCCELGKGSEEGQIMQVDTGGFRLWDYLTQNAGNGKLALIVWRKDALEKKCGAEFNFKDPDKRKAIERLLIIKVTDPLY